MSPQPTKSVLPPPSLPGKTLFLSSLNVSNAGAFSELYVHLTEALRANVLVVFSCQ